MVTACYLGHLKNPWLIDWETNVCWLVVDWYSRLTMHHCCYVEYGHWQFVWSVKVTQQCNWLCTLTVILPFSLFTTPGYPHIRSITSPSDRWTSSAPCCLSSSSAVKLQPSPSPTLVKSNYVYTCSLGLHLYTSVQSFCSVNNRTVQEHSPFTAICRQPRPVVKRRLGTGNILPSQITCHINSYR